MPSGRRLLDFVIAGGLAAPVLALALKHVTNVERRRKRARASVTSKLLRATCAPHRGNGFTLIGRAA